MEIYICVVRVDLENSRFVRWGLMNIFELRILRQFGSVSKLRECKY